MSLPLSGPIISPGTRPTSAVVLLHGYGADGNDLIALGEMWRVRFPETVFLSPNAPDELPFPGMGGRQWFPLTMRDAEEFWLGVNQAAPVLDAFLDDALEHYHLTSDRLALVGFSQGTMMALHVGMRRIDSLAAIVGFSGRLAGPEHLSTELVSRPPVQLIHGAEDDVIAVDAIHAAREALDAAEVQVEWHIQPGLGHGIDDAGLQLAAAFLATNLAL